MLLPSLATAVAKNLHLQRTTGRLLWPHQIEGVERCLRSNTLLGFEMGTGKTPTALVAVSHLQHVALVVPATAREVWLRELGRFTSRDRIVELRGVKALTANLLRVDDQGVVVHEEPAHEDDLRREWLLMTHESARSWATFMIPPGALSISPADPSRLPCLPPNRVDALVVDEAHRFGDRRNVGAQAIMTASNAADRVFLLSGTPSKGGVHRMWSLLKCLDSQEWGSYWDYIKRYCAAEEGKYGLEPTGLSNQDELAERLDPWVLAYTRDQVGAYLPKNDRQRVLVPLSAPKMRELGPIIEAADKVLKQRGERKGPDAWTSPEIVELRLALAKLKIDETVQLAAEIQAQGHKVVVWCWHRQVAAMMRTALSVARLQHYLSITGELTDESYVDRAVRHWSDTDRPVILIATMGKLGEARDLTAACWQIFLELDWLPETITQAESRLVRLSQTRPVSTRLMALDIPFERSLSDRLLGRAEETDALFGSETAAAVSELFGAKRMTDQEALAAFAAKVS